MKIEIKIEKDNPFMKRKELIVEIDHAGEATPTKASIQKEVASIKNISPEHVDVRKIFSRKGIAKSEAKIFVWEEPKVKDLSKEAEKKVAEEKEEKPEEKAESKEETENNEKEIKSEENKSNTSSDNDKSKGGGS